ncbi:outer membrane beta-barrel protein [Prosthecochloris sp. SCSIO W1101]|uniref:outer membrane protein n=1 Tax=Prosthecochloris sp. SCSIO W1101 TaxID=2992242 RepID=UPI00223CE337|nr:outer membrane beta-barrel protein [Prosthecochloris sp. SCSIO W1101]UZJ41031.1 outer membrane beta-barrel protein [Prosthecochloris sp. SCSIO W1101]
MKKFTSLCVALLVFFASAPLAQAATPYVSASASLALLSDSDIEEWGVTTEEAIEYKTGFAVNGALGLDGGMYRIEGAVGYQVNDWDEINGIELADNVDAEVSILSFMANGYLDIEMPVSIVTPYLTAGAGVANVSFDFGDGDSDDDMVFAYQFGAGVGIAAVPNVMLDLGYRYFATEDVSPADDVEVSIASHNIMAGVRVNF